jgi:hypothetical protein
VIGLTVRLSRIRPPSVSRSGPVALAAAVSLALGAAGHVAAHDVVDRPVPAEAVRAPLPAGSAARVSTTVVSQADYDRWRRIAVASRGGVLRTARDRIQLRRDVMNLLIVDLWVRFEASEHDVVLSDRQADRAFEKVKRLSFATEQAFRAFLRHSKMTEDDARFQVRFSTLQRMLQEHAVRRARTDAGRQRLAARFAGELRRKWRARTACGLRYQAPERRHVVATQPTMTAP